MTWQWSPTEVYALQSQITQVSEPRTRIPDYNHALQYSKQSRRCSGSLAWALAQCSRRARITASPPSIPLAEVCTIMAHLISTMNPSCSPDHFLSQSFTAVCGNRMSGRDTGLSNHSTTCRWRTQARGQGLFEGSRANLWKNGSRTAWLESMASHASQAPLHGEYPQDTTQGK